MDRKLEERRGRGGLEGLCKGTKRGRGGERESVKKGQEVKVEGRRRRKTDGEEQEGRLSKQRLRRPLLSLTPKILATGKTFVVLEEEWNTYPPTIFRFRSCTPSPGPVWCALLPDLRFIPFEFSFTSCHLSAKNHGSSCFRLH